jgi:hypothetical protein
VEGSADTTWVEQNVTGVTGLRVEVGEASGEPYTIDTGLVRVASIEHPAGVTVARVPDADAVAVPVASPVTPPAEAPAEPERPQRILPPDPQLETPGPEPEPVAPEPVAPEPVVPQPVVPTPPVAAPLPGAPLPPPSTYDPLTSPDLAVSASDLGTPSPRPSGAVARLVFSSGDVVDVDRVVVVGRAPDAGRVVSDGDVRLVIVPSPHQEISSTHVEIRPGEGDDEGSAVVTDLGSTNGTVVVQPGLPAEDLRPGVGVRLAPGSTIDLGEGLTIQAVQP